MESRFIWRGNYPALDFMNTQIVSKGQPQDLLASFEDVREWLDDSGYSHRIEGIESLTDTEKSIILSEILSVRLDLQRIVKSIVQGNKAVDPIMIENLNIRLKSNAGFIRLTLDGNLIQEEIHYPARQMVGFFLEQTVRLLVDLEPDKIKKCSNTKCVLHFYDNSRNSSRRWCDATQCGNRENVSQHYRRKKAAERTD